MCRVHITHKPIYRALGIENVKHRRGAKATKTQVLMRRLLALDYVIERPTLCQRFSDPFRPILVFYFPNKYWIC